MHSNDLQKAINNLIYYTTFEDNFDENLNDAKQILHLRIKPSSRGNDNQRFEILIILNKLQITKSTQISVETMAYVSKDDTLWCGHGSHIKIYEMESITLSNEIDDISLDEKIVNINEILN